MSTQWLYGKLELSPKVGFGIRQELRWQSVAALVRTESDVRFSQWSSRSRAGDAHPSFNRSGCGGALLVTAGEKSAHRTGYGVHHTATYGDDRGSENWYAYFNVGVSPAMVPIVE
jgi:hypothetical protein